MSINSFRPNTQEELKALKINDGEILFIVPDPYGMDRFINSVKVII